MSNVQPGQALGASYSFVEPLGSGAVGEVWRVRPHDPGADLAAKILREEHAQDAGLVERFVRERSVLLALRHPNIVAVRDLVVDGGRLAIVMDLVPGGSVREWLLEVGTLPPSQALELAAQMLDALAAAHAAGTTHRDIKPDNVLLAAPGDAAGNVRVSDFGIASVMSGQSRRTTEIMGTPAYMPPELTSRGEAGPAGDVYSAGIMLYELLSGRTPFAGSGTDFTIAFRHVSVMPPRIDVPGPLWDALAAMLHKDPTARPAAAEAATTLRALAAVHASLPALPPVVDPEHFEDLQRPATVLRGIQQADPEPTDAAATIGQLTSPEAPDLGTSARHTVFRQRRSDLPTPAAPPTEATENAGNRRRPSWLNAKSLGLLAAAVVLLAAVIAGSIALFGRTEPQAVPAPDATASWQGQATPSGLATARSVRYDAQAKQVHLEFTYSAQKAPLTGPFLEVLPAAPGTSGCPAVDFSQAQGERNQPSLTGISVECGWNLSGISIPARGQVTVQATLPLALSGDDALDQWLQQAAAATEQALADDRVEGSAYPAQRLQDIVVQTPARTVSGTTLPVTLVPVWPAGPDVLSPLYASPATGKPSATLRSIAGGEAGVRFSDACSGAVAVSGDGLVVTALSVTPQCTLRASVGNFTDLASEPFGITTRQ